MQSHTYTHHELAVQSTNKHILKNEHSTYAELVQLIFSEYPLMFCFVSCFYVCFTIRFFGVLLLLL